MTTKPIGNVHLDPTLSHGSKADHSKSLICERYLYNIFLGGVQKTSKSWEKQMLVRSNPLHPLPYTQNLSRFMIRRTF